MNNTGWLVPVNHASRMNQTSLPALIWSFADLLLGNYMQGEYRKVTLPFTVVRCLDCEQTSACRLRPRGLSFKLLGKSASIVMLRC